MRSVFAVLSSGSARSSESVLSRCDGSLVSYGSLRQRGSLFYLGSLTAYGSLTLDGPPRVPRLAHCHRFRSMTTARSNGTGSSHITAPLGDHGSTSRFRLAPTFWVPFSVNGSLGSVGSLLCRGSLLFCGSLQSPRLAPVERFSLFGTARSCSTVLSGSLGSLSCNGADGSLLSFGSLVRNGSAHFYRFSQ